MQVLETAYKRGLEGKPPNKGWSKKSLAYKYYLKGKKENIKN
jgi:hypothetical protein